MDSQTQNPNALVIADGFVDSGDTAASPLRGLGIRLKDRDYFSFTEKINVKGRTFAAYDRREGWQKLAEGIPPEYLMRQPGQPRPPQPRVDKKDWPLDLNGQPSHPWKLTRYLHLLDTATGEVSTFWSNTVGGRIAFDELSDQVRFMRQMQPNAVPIIALETKEMPTQYGSTKPRPYFHILGYKTRSGGDPQKLLTSEVEFKKPSLAEELNDDLPDFAKAPKAPKKKHKK